MCWFKRGITRFIWVKGAAAHGRWHFYRSWSSSNLKGGKVVECVRVSSASTCASQPGRHRIAHHKPTTYHRVTIHIRLKTYFIFVIFTLSQKTPAKGLYFPIEPLEIYSFCKFKKHSKNYKKVQYSFFLQNQDIRDSQSGLRTFNPFMVPCKNYYDYTGQGQNPL